MSQAEIQIPNLSILLHLSLIKFTQFILKPLVSNKFLGIITITGRQVIPIFLFFPIFFLFFETIPIYSYFGVKIPIFSYFFDFQVQNVFLFE